MDTYVLFLTDNRSLSLASLDEYISEIRFRSSRLAFLCYCVNKSETIVVFENNPI
jgi:hypothetical protein